MKGSSSLKNRLTLHFILVAALPLLLIAFWAVRNLSVSMESQVKEQNYLLAKSLAAELERFLRDPFMDLEHLKDVMESKEIISPDKMNAYLDSLTKADNIFNTIEILDRKGTITHLAPFDKNVIGLDMSSQEYYRNALDKKEPYWSRTFISLQTGKPTLTLTFPLKQGVLVGHLNLSGINKIIDLVKTGNYGTAVLTDRSGVTIAHPNRKLVSERFSERHLYHIQQGLEGNEGTFRYISEGVEKIGSVIIVSPTGWLLVVSRSVDEAFAHITELKNYIYAGILAAVILAILFAFINLRRILMPLTLIEEKAKKIAGGDYTYKSGKASYREIDNLDSSFKTMIDTVKIREEALQLERNKLINILNSMEDGVYIVNQQYDIEYVNPAIEKEFGKAEGRKCYEFIHDRKEVCPWCKNPEVLAGNTVHWEWYSQKKQKTYDLIDTPLINPDGSISKLEIFRDITERKNLEEERQKTHKLESIGILAGGIAHDFNNILAGILNNVYLSKMHMDRESKGYNSLESAEKAIYRASNLTQQLLTFAKGGTPIKKTSSIIEIIRESADFVLRGSNVKCQYIVADDLWPVEVDEGQMNQVIHNLILNADQAMPQGGAIQVSTENYNLGPDTGLPLKEGRYVKVAVQDQGIGISEKQLMSIFDPYFTTKEVGHGLGLSITYSIIKQHDGLLTAESELGVGTTFTIYLPASEKQVEEKKTAEDAPVAGEGKILIMDDEEIIRESVGEFLTMKGFEVEYAKDGEEAIELYKKAMETSKPFDAMILDLTIRGGMGGKTVIKKLLEIDPKVKAIVSSGYSNDPVMANYKEHGFSDVFCKASNNPDDLCRILNKVIKSH